MSTVYAIPTVRKAVQAFVHILNDHISTPAIRYDVPGRGEDRARKRLAEKRKANKAIPSIATESRQVRRFRERKGDLMERVRLQPYGRRGY